MQIFVTGATGVLGKAVVPGLLADGHVVYALSRSQANTAVLQGLAAKPVPADLFDGQGLVQALVGCEAEAILHLATSIPPTMQIGRRKAWQENDHIRREGTRALVEAALAAGTVSTFIYPSYALVYPESGDRWIDAETTPVQPAVNLSSTLDAEVEVARFAGNERRGISLRMGSLYGPEPTSWQLLRYARRGIAAYPPGALDAYLPQIWVPDAASALVALHQLGISQARIAEQVGIGHSTVSRWLAASGPLERRPGPYVSRLDPYLPYLFQRWESGCHNMVRLHQELVAQDYKGSYGSVRDHLVRRLPEGKKNSAKGNELAPTSLPSKQATFLFLTRPEQLDAEEQETVRQFRQSDPEVDQAYDLIQKFAQMLRTRTGKKLEEWLATALASQIPEFRSFVAGIERDKDAVKAGLTRPESNDHVA